MLVKQAYVCYPPGYAWPFDYHMGRLFFWNKIKFRPLLSWAHHLLAEEEKRCRVKHRKPSDISETRFPPPFALCFNSVCTHICHLSHQYWRKRKRTHTRGHLEKGDLSSRPMAIDSLACVERKKEPSTIYRPSNQAQK